MAIASSSAEPSRLKEYSDGMRSWNHELVDTSRRLANVLAQVEARCREYPVHVSHLAPALQRHATHADEIDQWIHEVGVQFELADSGLLGGFNTDDVRVSLCDLYDWYKLLNPALAGTLIAMFIRAGSSYSGQIIINLPDALRNVGISLRSIRETAGLSGYLNHIKYTNLPGHIGRIGLIASVPVIVHDWYKDIHTYVGSKLASAIVVDTSLALAPIGAAWAGAKGGALVGAAIGSVVPGVGTAVGGAIGAIVGGVGAGIAASWAIEKSGVRNPAIEWVDDNLMRPTAEFIGRSYERVRTRIVEGSERLREQAGILSGNVIVGASNVLDRLRSTGSDAGRRIQEGFQQVVDQGHALTQNIGNQLSSWGELIHQRTERTIEVGHVVWDSASTYVREGRLQAEAKSLLEMWRTQITQGFESFKSEVARVWTEYVPESWEMGKSEFEKRFTMEYFTKYMVGNLIVPGTGFIFAELAPGEDWMWAVGGEMLLGMVPIIGDGKDIVQQEWNRHTGGEVDELVYSLALIGLTADAVAMGDSPVPGPADAPNAAVGALKGVAKQIGKGPARDALAEVVEKAAKNPEELKVLTDSAAALVKNRKAFAVLSESPDALVVALKNGNEAIELAAKYGDDAVAIFAEHGDAGYELLRIHGDHVIDRGFDTFLDASVPTTDEFMRFGELASDSTYIRNGYAHSTDSLGRVERISGQLKLEEGLRTPHQTEVGHLGIENDHGGHLIGAQFGGSPEGINLVPQNGNLNQGKWKSMETMWAKALDEGKQVQVDIRVEYPSPDSARPEVFNVEYTIDGVRRTEFFINQPGG